MREVKNMWCPERAVCFLALRGLCLLLLAINTVPSIQDFLCSLFSTFGSVPHRTPFPSYRTPSSSSLIPLFSMYRAIYYFVHPQLVVLYPRGVSGVVYWSECLAH